MDEQAVTGTWRAAFDTAWNTPAFIDMETLYPLNESDDTALKHYSGSVLYTHQFTYTHATDTATNNTVILDLGQVFEIAEVRLNGQVIATKWIAPYQFDITNKVKEGQNQLEIVVTNTWRSQLILDVQRPLEQKKTWTTNPPSPSDNMLDKSGLVGPVLVRTSTVGVGTAPVRQ